MGSPERIRPVAREEWERVRDLRLHALADAPDAFGSTLERERSVVRSGSPGSRVGRGRPT